VFDLDAVDPEAGDLHALAAGDFDDVPGEAPVDGHRAGKQGLERSLEPGAETDRPASTSGRVRPTPNWHSSNRNGRPPKWSPCKCVTSTPSISSLEKPQRFQAVIADAPKSTTSVRAAASTRKHV